MSNRDVMAQPLLPSYVMAAAPPGDDVPVPPRTLVGDTA